MCFAGIVATDSGLFPNDAASATLANGGATSTGGVPVSPIGLTFPGPIGTTEALALANLSASIYPVGQPFSLSRLAVRLFSSVDLDVGVILEIVLFKNGAPTALSLPFTGTLTTPGGVFGLAAGAVAFGPADTLALVATIKNTSAFDVAVPQITLNATLS